MSLQTALVALAKYTILEPVLTGSILLALTRGPPEVQSYLDRLPKLPSQIPYELTPNHVLNAIRLFFVLGLLRRISGLLNRWASNNWEFFYSGKPWVMKQEVAVVTGGSGDIAAAMIEKLIPTGMKLALLDIQPPRPKIMNAPNVHFYKCDLTSSKAIHEAAVAVKKDLGAPTILVNNAGLGNGASIIEISDEQLERIFKVNIMSHWYTCREFLPDMINGKKGHVMTVASMASYTAVAGVVDYCATKSAALAFHEGLTQELRHLYDAPFVRTTIVHPFWVKTAMTAPIEEGISKSDNLMTPQYVGNIMAKQLISGRGGQLIIPENNPKMMLAPMTRGWPAWLHSYANDTTKENVLTALKEQQAELLASKGT